jgi:hypothetical protein
MKLSRVKKEVRVCSKDPENIYIKMDEDAPKASNKIQVPRLHIHRRWKK